MCAMFCIDSHISVLSTNSLSSQAGTYNDPYELLSRVKHFPFTFYYHELTALPFPLLLLAHLRILHDPYSDKLRYDNNVVV